MSDTATDSLSFADVVIDLAGRRVLRGGEVQTLEPKAFAVLVLLAGAPGQAFERDQILDAVWGHRHVTPGVLNRVMSLLRHALGEDASNARYLHTLHGVGYRFDLPAIPVVVDPEPFTAQATGTASDDRRARVERRVPDQAAPPIRRRGQRRWLVAGLGVLALGLMVAGGWWEVRRGAFRGVAPIPTALPVPSAPTLVVMPLKPIGEGEGDLAAGLSDELISALAQIPGLRVIARESTGLAAAGSAGIGALVSGLGITHALEGSLRQSGEQLRINLRLIDARTGRTLWAQGYDRSAVDVLALQRDVAQAVAAALTLKFGLGAAPAAKGGDADFLRRYYAARALLEERGSTQADAVERAETAFRALARQRPDDARAHAGLALALDRRAYGDPPLAADLRAEAAHEAAVALQRDANLPEPYRVQAAAACRGNRWAACLGLYQKARQLAPSESQPHFQYAMALASLGYLDRAEAVLRDGLRTDPFNPGWHFGYGRILDTLGRHDAARAQLLRSEGFSPYGRWFNAVWRGDLDEASRLAQALGSGVDASTYERMLKPSYVATSLALRDPTQWPAAEAEMRKSERSTGLMNFLRVFVPGADSAQLIAGLDVVRKRSYSTWDLLLWTRELARLRSDPAFQAYLRDSGILAHWRQQGFPPQCRAQGDGAICG